MTSGMFKNYYELSKPGIIYGNILTTAAGFFVATTGAPAWALLGWTVLGLSLIIASGAVFNNYFDRTIDARMERTKTRAFVVEAVSPLFAYIYAVVAVLLGALLLYIYANTLSLEVALFGWVVYVCLYTPLKHHSSLAVFVGALAGATPPVVGYTAVLGMLDMTAVWLFVALFLWQIPHFYAISLYRYDEYAKAGVPLLVKTQPTARAKRVGRIVFYFSLVLLVVACGVLMF